MKLRKFLSLLLCLCMVMTLLPATALAVDATINYLDITVDSEGNPTGCVYKGATDTDIEGILGLHQLNHSNTSTISCLHGEICIGRVVSRQKR